MVCHVCQPRRRLSSRAIIVTAVSVTLALAGCRGVRTLPEGEQTLRGTLKPVEISRVRRGTHELLQNNLRVAYVESTTLNLRRFEEGLVDVTGTFEHNTNSSDDPVLVAVAVKLLDDPNLRTVDIPKLDVSLRVPLTWNPVLSNTGAQFLLSGTLLPILTVSLDSHTELPTPSTVFVGTGSILRLFSVASKRGVIFYDAATRERKAYIDRGVDPVTGRKLPLLLLHMVPLSPDAAEKGERALETVLQSVRFGTGATLSFSSRPLSPSTGTGSQGEVCGGPAGLLCPAGFFCNVTDPDGVGRCKKL